MVRINLLTDFPGLFDVTLLDLEADVPGGLGDFEKNVRKRMKAF